MAESSKSRTMEPTGPHDTETPAQARPNWRLVDEADGVARFQLSSWSDFFDFLEQEVFDTAGSGNGDHLVWRGQRRSDWSLSTSLDRVFDSLGLLALDANELEAHSSAHLEAFIRASRGRRGHNPVRMGSETDWWALGQHYGLATPLLDWSRSPFAAAYFAFEEGYESTENRVVYGLNERACRFKSQEIRDAAGATERGRLPVLEFFDPISDENPRLVSQGGLFTRSPIGMPIEKWIAGAFDGSDNRVLLRIEIPNRDRADALRTLNRMNINHLSLFPDLSGASRYSNLRMELAQRRPKE